MKIDPEGPMVRMAVNVPIALWRRLGEATERFAMSRNELIEAAIEQYLAEDPGA